MTARRARDVDKTYNKMHASRRWRRAPGFAWREYFAPSTAPT
jgi:hypothetical protein